MPRYLFYLIAIFCLTAFSVYSQETDYGPGYQTGIMKNPALTGSSGSGVFRMSYLNFFPGHNYNFHSVFTSFDSYFPKIHGGAGIYISDDIIGGIVNDLRGGVSYSYFLQAEKDLYINAGLSASFFRRGFNFSNAVLPDQIDPLGNVSLPSSEALINDPLTLFDLGTGVVFISGRYFGGFSILHLNQPDLGPSESAEDKLKRKYCIHLAAEYDIDKRKHLKLQPLIAGEIQGLFISASAGAVVGARLFSASSLFLFNNNGDLDLQTGFSFRKEQITILYNYRFNLKSGNAFLPFSLSHQAGLAFNLNNVEKRIKVRTINLPSL